MNCLLVGRCPDAFPLRMMCRMSGVFRGGYHYSGDRPCVHWHFFTVVSVSPVTVLLVGFFLYRGNYRQMMRRGVKRF